MSHIFTKEPIFMSLRSWQPVGDCKETRNPATLQEVKTLIEDLGILLKVIPNLNTKLTHKH